VTAQFLDIDKNRERISNPCCEPRNDARKFLYQEFILTSDNLASLNLEESNPNGYRQGGVEFNDFKISWKRRSKSRGKGVADALWLN
jgi:hypothetical protein